MILDLFRLNGQVALDPNHAWVQKSIGLLKGR